MSTSLTPKLSNILNGLDSNHLPSRTKDGFRQTKTSVGETK